MSAINPNEPGTAEHGEFSQFAEKSQQRIDQSAEDGYAQGKARGTDPSVYDSIRSVQTAFPGRVGTSRRHTDDGSNSKKGSSSKKTPGSNGDKGKGKAKEKMDGKGKGKERSADYAALGLSGIQCE